MSCIRPTLAMIMAGIALASAFATGCRRSEGSTPPIEWLSYRHDQTRTGQQPINNALSNPTTVLASLHVVWGSPGSVTWTSPTMPGPYRASPIVVDANKTLYIGDLNGVLWAIDATTGAFRWRYPATGPGLNGTCTNYGKYGISSAASYAVVNNEAAIIFGAPDPDPGTDGGRGSGRLWAVDANTGRLIWKSDVVAHVTGCTPNNRTELHQRITNSAPMVSLLFNGPARVFVGVSDTQDDPVQKGQLAAINLTNGHTASGFPFLVVGSPTDPHCGGVCGGAIWDAPASVDGASIIFTTGNVCLNNVAGAPPCETEPSPDYSLSMVSVNMSSGALNWSFRAVPFALDSDLDWAAGPTAMGTSCGSLLGSVQKDGHTYAISKTDGSCKWQFPPTAGSSCRFPSTATIAGGEYHAPGASWGNSLIIETGGYALTSDGPVAGYGLLHALNACSPESSRVRWIAAPEPSVVGQSSPPLGAPVVSGGMVYVTTSNGHLVALADPTIATPAGYTCSNVNFGPPSTNWQQNCVNAGYSVVPVPRSRDVALPDGGNAAVLRMEPAIALNMLYVATEGGHIYALSP
jgi:outer membrane protein assembly factor BamB